MTTPTDTGLVEPTVARVQHVCDVCGVFDDHPRHSQWAPGAAQAVPSKDVVTKVLAVAGDGPHAAKARQLLELLAFDDSTVTVIGNALRQVGSPDEVGQGLIDLFDTGWILRHLDCCKSVGCPDGSCDEVLAGANGARGADLVTYIVTVNPAKPATEGV